MVTQNTGNDAQVPVTENCPNAPQTLKDEFLGSMAQLRAFVCSSTGALGQWTAAELAALKAEVEAASSLLEQVSEGDLSGIRADLEAARAILAQFDPDGDGRINAVVQLTQRLESIESQVAPLNARLGAVEQTLSQHTQTLGQHTTQLQTLGQQQQLNTQEIASVRTEMDAKICGERQLMTSVFEGLTSAVETLLSEPCPLPTSVMGVTGANGGSDGGETGADPSTLLA